MKQDTTTFSITLTNELIAAIDTATPGLMSNSFEHQLITLLEEHQLMLAGLRNREDPQKILTDLDIRQVNNQTGYLTR